MRSTKKERLRNFRPAKVRDLIVDGGVVLMDEDWYADLCETYTHIAPGVAPNQHNDMNRPVCGGMVQEKGLAKSIDQLTTIVGLVALFYCRYFDFDDLFEELSRDAVTAFGGSKGSRGSASEPAPKPPTPAPM